MSFVFEGWSVAQCLREAGLTTLCPSIGPLDTWFAPRSEKILRASLEQLQERGFQHLFIAGQSEGAPAAIYAANLLRSRLSGLMLFSGINPEGEPVPLPTLILRGSFDRKTDRRAFRAYARRAGSLCALVEVRADGLLLLRRRGTVRKNIARWVDRVVMGSAVTLNERGPNPLLPTRKPAF